MIQATKISRDSSGNTTLTHDVTIGTYSSAPSDASDGFWIKSRGSRNYDAYELVFTLNGGDATTKVSFRPWFYVPDHQSGVWLAGDLLGPLPVAEATDSSFSPVERFGSVPVSATKMYIQVTAIDGTSPSYVYFTIYGLEGNVAGGSASTGGSGGGSSSSSASASASAGGGDAVYISPEDFVVSYTSATTLTLIGLPYTPNTEQFISVSVFDSTGKETIYTPSNNAFSYNSTTGVLTVTNATFDAADIGYRVLIWGPDKAYNNSIDAKKTVIINPVWEQYGAYTLFDVTNGIDGDYYYYIDMATYTKAAFQFILNSGSGSVTVMIYGTTQDDGTAPDLCTYEDIMYDVFNVASLTSDDILVDDAGKLGLFKYIKVKVTASTGGANDADWICYVRQIY